MRAQSGKMRTGERVESSTTNGKHVLAVTVVAMARVVDYTHKTASYDRQ